MYPVHLLLGGPDAQVGIDPATVSIYLTLRARWLDGEMGIALDGDGTGEALPGLW